MRTRLYIFVIAALQTGFQTANAEPFSDIQKEFSDQAAHKSAVQSLVARNPQMPSPISAILVDSSSRKTVTTGPITFVEVDLYDFHGENPTIDVSYERYDTKSLLVTETYLSNRAAAPAEEMNFDTEIQRIDRMEGDAGSGESNTKARYIASLTLLPTFQGFFDKYEETCTIKPGGADAITRSCHMSGIRAYHGADSPSDTSLEKDTNEAWTYSPTFKAYLPPLIGSIASLARATIKLATALGIRRRSLPR